MKKVMFLLGVIAIAASAATIIIGCKECKCKCHPCNENDLDKEKCKNTEK